MKQRELILSKLYSKSTGKIPFTINNRIMPFGETARKLIAEGLGVNYIDFFHEEINSDVQICRKKKEIESRLYIEETWQSPIGSISKLIEIEPSYQSEYIVEHFVKTDADYKVLEWIIRNQNYVFNTEKYQMVKQRLGDDGVVLARARKTAFQMALIKYIGVEKISIDLYEKKEGLLQLLDTLKMKNRELINVLADSPAELIWLPENLHGPMIGKERFKQFCLPAYNEYEKILLQAGKRMCVHMDGHLKCLVDLIATSKVSVVEAFTPPPDGDLEVEEALNKWQNKIIWFNYPASIISKPASEIKAYTEELLQKINGYHNILIGITEDVPATRLYESLSTILNTLNSSDL